MAVSAKLYDKYFLSANAATINFTSDSIKVMLCTSTYTPNQGTHQFKSDITNEVTGTGYTATGVALGTKTATTATRVATFDAADTSWTTSTITARYAVVYDATPASDATRPLICYVDFGADVISSGGTFSITWDALGIWTLTAA
jgi:hypothetical protein